jgi:hypothetical protein
MSTAELMGNFGEFFGAIVVVASLLYVAKQVRDSSTQIRINTTGNTATLVNDGFAPIYATDQNQDIWHKGISCPEDLTEAEYVRFDMLMYRVFYAYQVSVIQYDEGVIDKAQFDAASNYYRFLYGQPGGRRWWTDHGSAFSSRMRFHLERTAPTLANLSGLRDDSGV